MFKFIVLLCLVFTCHGQGNNATDDGRLVNGQVIPITMAPFIVQLRSTSTSTFVCGGTLLSATHVLTAAHCFDGISPYDITVVGAANTRIEEGVKRRVVGYKISPGYSKETLNMDYAVLKLQSPMAGFAVTYPKVCSKIPMVGDTMRVYGWGQTSQQGPLSPQLRTITAPLISQVDCAARHGYANPQITNSMICAFNPGQDTCFGDSGTAGVVNGEICGIVSWGRGCLVGQASVYTNVYLLQNYINDAIRTLA